MSDMIKITIVIEDQNGIAREKQKNIEVTQKSGATLMSTLQKNNLISESFCGGNGICGKCRVQFLEAAPLPTAVERSVFSPAELRQGYRLACMVRPKNNSVIRLDFAIVHELNVVTDVMGMSLDNDYDSQHREEEITYVIAIDIGTTTIAMQLREMDSGKIVDSYGQLNPQRRFGADVLSRIQAAEAGHAKEMKESVWQAIEQGVRHFMAGFQAEGQMGGQAERLLLQRLKGICIAGNTTMEHLFMGLPTKSLGQSPFTPVEIGWQRSELVIDETTIPILLVPGINTFVGGDIVAGLYYCGLLHKKYEQKTILFLDLGTNGEMAITDGARMIVTATAAGPAFEGRSNAAVTGSDMIALTASLLKQGIVDETGLMAEPYFTNGIEIKIGTEIEIGTERKTGTATGEDKSFILTQQDIRALQMAKAAVRAGTECLFTKLGATTVQKVYLAGGFGYYLNVEAALQIGLLQKEMGKNTQAAGNTALAGAYLLGRDIWQGRLQEEELLQTISSIESINLAREENFEKLYLQALDFPAKER